MNDMIDTIRAAVAEGATAGQKVAAAQACRAILTALEAEVGKPIALAGAPMPGPLAGISPDQALDLVIARLRVAAETRSTAAVPPPIRNPEPSGPRIVFVQPPRGLPRPPRRKP